MTYKDLQKLSLEKQKPVKVWESRDKDGLGVTFIYRVNMAKDLKALTDIELNRLLENRIPRRMQLMILREQRQRKKINNEE